MLNCYENNNCLFLKSIVILRWFEPVQSIINVNAYVCLLVNYFLHHSMESTWCKLLKNSKDKIFCKMKDEIWRGRLCFYLIEASATYLSFRNILEYIHGTSTCYCLLLSTEPSTERRILPSQPYWEIAQLWVTPTTITMTKNKIKIKTGFVYLFFDSWNSLHGLST